MVAGLGVLVVVAVLSIGVGAHAVAPAEVVRALLAYQGPSDHVIVVDVRAPRRTARRREWAPRWRWRVSLVQTLSRNPLAEPGILGVTAGAGFTITVGSALGWPPRRPANSPSPWSGAVLAASGGCRSAAGRRCVWCSPGWR